MTVSRIKAEWLQSKPVQQVVEALGENTIKFVGGVVRDTLLGLPVDDIDAATLHRPEETMQLLKTAGVKVIPTGLQHGTVTAVLENTHIEITTLRIDMETDGRHAEVAFTDNWLEDAKRRDFTFNALYLSPDGVLYDPFDGQQDLLAGRVRFIGDASERIKEDALRIMRFFRFYSHYGKGALDTNALDACSHLASMLGALSVERIRAELSKLLKAANPLPSLKAMVDAKLFTALGYTDVRLTELEPLINGEQALGAEIEPLVRLYHLFAGVIEAAGLAKWLKLSRKDRFFLKVLERAHQALLPSDKISMRAYIYKYGTEVSRAVAVAGGHKAFYTYSTEWQAPAFPVQGRDLMAAGMLAGPAVGKALNSLEKLWVDSDFSLNKVQLLDRLRTV